MKFHHKNKRVRFIEFLFVGVFLGVIEDLIAILLATDATFHPRIIFIAFIVAVPFAYFSEYIVDHPDFWKKILPKNFFDDKDKDNIPDFLERKK